MACGEKLVVVSDEVKVSTPDSESVASSWLVVIFSRDVSGICETSV